MEKRDPDGKRAHEITGKYHLKKEIGFHCDSIVKRKGEGIDSFLEIHLYHQGDVFVFVQGVDRQGKPSEAQIEFCAPNGGGWHPNTIKALYELAKAIQKDNEEI